MINQVGAATGGTEIYTGLTMKLVHQGMNIKDADFNALVEDLTASLVKYNVQSKAKIELLTALGGLKADIVGSNFSFAKFASLSFVLLNQVKVKKEKSLAQRVRLFL